MTTDEHKKLKDILALPPWMIKQHLSTFVEEAEVVSPTRVAKETRTDQQNKALHKWFEQIAEQCRDGGISAKMAMSQTASMEMNAEMIKGMWRAMQSYLYGTTSTTKLTKDQQIDVIVDHLVRFFGEKFNLVLPPFPSREPQMMGTIPNTSVPYPSNYEEPTI